MIFLVTEEFPSTTTRSPRARTHSSRATCYSVPASISRLGRRGTRGFVRTCYDENDRGIMFLFVRLIRSDHGFIEWVIEANIILSGNNCVPLSFVHCAKRTRRAFAARERKKRKYYVYIYIYIYIYIYLSVTLF